MTAVDVAAVPRSLLKEEESALAEARTGTSTSLGSRSGVVMRMGSVRAPLVAVEGEVAECSGEGEGMGRPRDLMGKLQVSGSLAAAAGACKPASDLGWIGPEF